MPVYPFFATLVLLTVEKVCQPIGTHRNGYQFSCFRHTTPSVLTKNRSNISTHLFYNERHNKWGLNSSEFEKKKIHYRHMTVSLFLFYFDLDLLFISFWRNNAQIQYRLHEMSNTSDIQQVFLLQIGFRIVVMVLCKYAHYYLSLNITVLFHHYELVFVTHTQRPKSHPEVLMNWF